MQSRQRYCNNPKPSADGDFCDGSASDVRLCNQQQCPRHKASFSVYNAIMGSNGVLRFKIFLLNEGSFFDKTTGVFTCRYPGVYVYIANVIEGGKGNNAVYCAIRRNQINLVSMNEKQGYIDGGYALDGYGASTGAVTIHLLKGDRMDISCSNNTGPSLGRSSFTGYLLGIDP